MKRTALIIGISLLIGMGLSVLYMQIVALTDTKILSSESDEVESYDGSLAPPDALKGSIIYMNGEVLWQSRSATKAAMLDRSTLIQQGETIKTGSDGEVTILFDEDTLIDIFSESSASFTQTLPANIVITHSGGEVEYSQKTSSIPLSIRIRHLLVKLNAGTISITLDETENEDKEIEESNVTVRVIEGSATAVWNSLKYETNYAELDEGESLFYNDISRESEIL